MSVEIKRTNGTHEDFISLVAELDLYLKSVDGDLNNFYDQYNKIDKIKYAIVIYLDQVPVACGAIKDFGDSAMEVKRMYVQTAQRRMGLAHKILLALESWAKELNKTRCVLETGKPMKDAIAFYHKAGYRRIPNYGQYIGIDNSICFEKNIE